MSADTATGSPVASLRVIGRGRGFRNTSESIQTPLRRPNVGPVVEQSRLSLADITLKMQYLTLETVDEDGKQIKGLVERFSTSSTKLQAVVQSLYELALENYHYAAVAARLCHRMANVEVGETKFRNLVLKLLQADYEGRDILRGEGNDSYDACSLFAFVTFLVELYALLRTQNGEPLRALLTPVFVCLKELLTGLDNTEEEMEHCARELKRRGKFLHEQDSSRMEELLRSLRDKIVDSETSGYARCLLLEVLEMNARGWALTDETKEYYKHAIDRV